ncbi:CDP-glucose 4,6-dehydratase [Pandoraea sp.]|uniref:CDP-glucose 4,6-dehydratase n=1 Tax=Pandoraea sp. TaxID=1883445 RepID=UPI0012104A47|nr:CDP-glucose 4,6-dehydratase [Pandoraea sp.]TAL55370.1 MAG: CDP-glucose 4,6-dehydratase [Pandoraea sp.]
MNESFWRGKRVFLTGHTGFKGGWLSIWLQHLGAELTGYALTPSTDPSLFEIAHVGAHMTSIIGDVRDLDALKLAVKDAQPEIVIHMAAQPLVRYSYANPVETYSTNVMGTVHLLEAVRCTQGVRAVLNVTSDKCYENREWVWGYRENEPMGGYDPYSNSKGCAELVTEAYRHSYFNPGDYAAHGISLASARAGNVIGGGDWAFDRLIPDIMRGIQSGTEVIIRSPHAIRPWQHVLEPLSGYMTLVEHLYDRGTQFSGPWNFGPNENDSKPVSWIVEQLTALWGGEARYRIDLAAANLHEAHYLKLDCSKARMQLGWQPRWSLGEALQRIVEWHRAFLRGDDMRQCTLHQIQHYMEVD